MNKQNTLAALKRLADYLETSIGPEEMALELRRSAYLLGQLRPADDIDYGNDIKRASYHLHSLAEELEPYLYKDERLT